MYPESVAPRGGIAATVCPRDSNFLPGWFLGLGSSVSGVGPGYCPAAFLEVPRVLVVITGPPGFLEVRVWAWTSGMATSYCNLTKKTLQN